MNYTKNEYSGSITRNINDYSSIPEYGVHGTVHGIMAPSPSTVTPAMFNPLFYHLTPHAPPNPVASKSSKKHLNPHSGYLDLAPTASCNNYTTLNKMCLL